MSKKETEFDRYDRMKRMEKELEVQKRKLSSFSNDTAAKKGGKQKSSSPNSASRWNWSRDKDEAEEYDYV